MRTKVTSFLSLTLLFITIFFVPACSDNSTAGTGYQRVILCIEADEHRKAATYCGYLSDQDLAEGKEPIFSAVVMKLNNRIKNKNTWCCNKYDGIIDDNIITEFKDYKTILKLINTSSSTTNAVSFINSVLTLETYSSWNEFYKTDSSSLSAGLEYIIEAQTSNTSTVEQYYYGLAYKEMYDAYLNYKAASQSAKGIGTTTKYCNTWVQVLAEWRNGNSATRSTSYDSAYKKVLNEFSDVLNEVEKTTDSWPSKIY